MVLNKVAEVIVETAHCKIEDVTPEAELVALGVDSLKAITVLFELEEAFDIEIPNEVIPSIVTVNDILEKIDVISANRTDDTDTDCSRRAVHEGKNMASM